MAPHDPRYHSGRRSLVEINTSNSGAMPGSRGGSGRQRFSYVETPTDMQEAHGGNQRFFPGHNAIQEQAVSPIEGYHIQTRSPIPTTALHTAQGVPRTSSPHGIPEPRGIHPAYYAPVVSQSQTPYTDPRSRSPPHHPSSPPLAPTDPRSTMHSPHQRSSTIPLNPESEEDRKSPTSPHQPDRITIPYSPSHPVFHPTSLAGPNGMAPSMHRPGQVAHPNMSPSDTKTPWTHSLCECNSDVSTCLTGIFCPCVLDSRTAYRMERKGEHKDPTDLLGFKSVNARCGAMGLLGGCGVFCLFPLTLRTRIRHAYKLQGNFLSDVVQACCCCCCVVIQNEREVREREDRIRVHAGPATTAQGYGSDVAGGMVYQPGGGGGGEV